MAIIARIRAKMFRVMPAVHGWTGSRHQDASLNNRMNTGESVNKPRHKLFFNLLFHEVSVRDKATRPAYDVNRHKKGNIQNFQKPLSRYNRKITGNKILKYVRNLMFTM
jgi:hypothetical protein